MKKTGLPSINLAMITVNMGAEDLTVSVNETAMNLSATRPRSTVVNL